jgi:hypothetical protein
MTMWNGFLWFKTGSSGTLFRSRLYILVAKRLLAFKEEFWSTALVTLLVRLHETYKVRILYCLLRSNKLQLTVLAADEGSAVS